jgi:hypothetical protein
MSSLVQWQTLLFLIPLGVGGLLAVGAALGFLEGGGGEGEGEVDADGEGEDGSTWLALGRVPLTVRLLLLTVPFGSVGLAVTYLLGGMESAGLRAVIAAAVAGATTWGVAGWAARIFRSRVRMLETETISRRELVGGAGKAVLGIGASSGLAQVKDRRGNLHQVSCRMLGGEAPLRAGAEVLVVDYDEEGRVYYVTANPAAAVVGGVLGDAGK